MVVTVTMIMIGVPRLHLNFLQIQQLATENDFQMTLVARGEGVKMENQENNFATGHCT